MKNKKILKLTLTALLSALCYVSFTFLKITIPTPLGYTSFHLGNTFVLVAAMLLNGPLGGIAGAIGMGIGDILDPRYIVVAPKTIILKMTIGLVCGYFAHNVFKIREIEGRKLTISVILSSFLGMIANVIGEPLFGYFYYKYVLNAPERALKALTSFNLASTGTNAILAIIIASLLYLGIRKRFKDNNFFRNSEYKCLFKVFFNQRKTRSDNFHSDKTIQRRRKILSA